MERTFVLIELPQAWPGAAPEFLGRWGGQSSLERVVRQATDSLCIGHVAVVAPRWDDSLRDRIPPDVPVLVSERPDALGRLTEAAESCGAHAVVRVDGGQPLIDPAFIDRLMVAADEEYHADYIGYVDEDGQFLSDAAALFPEWCRVSALVRGEREAFRSTDRQQATRYMRRQPQRFRLVPLPVASHDLAAARRFVLGLMENREMVEAVCETLGAEDWDWRRIADHLQGQSLSTGD